MRVWANVAAAVLMCGSLALGQESAGATTRPAASANAPAAKLMDELEFGKNGCFEIDGVSFGVLHFGVNWTGMAKQDWCNPESGYPKNGDTTYENLWLMGSEAGKLSCRQTIQGIDVHTIRYEMVAKSEQAAGVASSTLYLEVTLPASRYRGQTLVADMEEVELPAQKSTTGWGFSREKVRRLQIATPGGILTIQGPMPIYVADYGDNFGIRIFFNPNSGLITESRLKLKLSWKPLEAAEKK